MALGKTRFYHIHTPKYNIDISKWYRYLHLRFEQLNFKKLFIKLVIFKYHLYNKKAQT